jgi:tetratricopeptide (TPR) repeat protein
MASMPTPVRPAWPGALLLFGMTLLAYLPALAAGMVWNDLDYVTAPALRPVAGLRLIWFKVGATLQYCPVLHSAFWLEHRLWGDTAAGYHAVNILLHAGSACLLVLILRRLAVRGAWLAGALFALHPVCVESVAWISEQKNTLSTVFYLLAALTYLGFDQNRRWGSYATAFGLFTLALLTKSLTATLPAALLVVFWWQRGRLSWRRDLLPLVPWFAIGAAAGLFTGWVERSVVGAQGADFAFSPIARILIAGRAIWFYLGKLLWPADLIFIYPRWQIDPRLWWQYLFPVGALALNAGLWAIRARTRAPLAAWLLFLGALFPVLGFLNVYAFLFSFVADHWQYLAILAVAPLAGAAWARIGGGRGETGRWRPGKNLLAGAVLGLLGLLTWRQCWIYRDPRTFYRALLARNPACWMAHTNLGLLLEGEGRTEEAIAQFETALQLRPGYAEGCNNLGVGLSELGLLSEALAQFDRAVRLKPGYAEAHNNIGSILYRLGRTAEAIPQFEQAIGLQADYAQARRNLGLALQAMGRQAEAQDQFARAARLEAVAAGRIP